MDEGDRRAYVVDFLVSAGLHHDNLAYNRESVEFTLDRRPGFAEFGTLFPYPKTKATEWCEARGDFDGDYEKLHASYQTKSPLRCFTEEEKTRDPRPRRLQGDQGDRIERYGYYHAGHCGFRQDSRGL